MIQLLSRLIQILLKPFTRVLLGFIAIPLFRLLMRKVVRIEKINEELEKDLEQWFRGSLLLLIASGNMEDVIFRNFLIAFGSMEDDIFRNFSEEFLSSPYFLAGRLLLAVGVIEGMPDQALFAIIHPGPKKPQLVKGHLFRSLIQYLPQLIKGLICQHLNRSSPVFAILSVLYKDQVGWTCYWIAIAQYLLIGLVTSKDKALDVMSQFDAAVALRRHELEFDIHPKTAAKITAEAQLKTMDPNVESL